MRDGKAASMTSNPRAYVSFHEQITSICSERIGEWVNQYVFKQTKKGFKEASESMT